MSKQKNTVWGFLASVKLTLFNLITLAVASVIGTLIPQGMQPNEYINIFGESWAKFFHILDLVPDMYNSWWFTGLLVLFSINLIICTIDRLPNVFRLITMNNLDTDPERVAKMSQSITITSPSDVQTTTGIVQEIMSKKRWKPEKAEKEGTALLFSQKGAWTRLGAYIVHVSILIIFIGAIIGSIFGYKGSIFIPESISTDKIYRFGTGEPVPLGFNIRCDQFTLSYYKDRSPSEYKSLLTVIDPEQGTFSKAIEVNDPLEYKGFTFYQSSYESHQRFIVTLKNLSTGDTRIFGVYPGKLIKWPGTDISFGITKLMLPNRFGAYAPVDLNAADPIRDFKRFQFLRTETPMGMYKASIWFSDGKKEDDKEKPSIFTVEGDTDKATTAVIERGDTSFSFSIKEHFSTGLQVAKDPGVWYVYIGCTIMILGLYVAFFLSHRRIWAYIREEDNKTKIDIGGLANKNKMGFENEFNTLVSAIEQDQRVNDTKE